MAGSEGSKAGSGVVGWLCGALMECLQAYPGSEKSSIDRELDRLDDNLVTSTRLSRRPLFRRWHLSNLGAVSATGLPRETVLYTLRDSWNP
jgi:hypothetical protein